MQRVCTNPVQCNRALYKPYIPLGAISAPFVVCIMVSLFGVFLISPMSVVRSAINEEDNRTPRIAADDCSHKSVKDMCVRGRVTGRLWAKSFGVLVSLSGRTFMTGLSFCFSFRLLPFFTKTIWIESQSFEGICKFLVMQVVLVYCFFDSISVFFIRVDDSINDSA